MGQGIISRSNPGNTGDKVGDIRITTRDSLGSKWALCNGEEIPSDSDYRVKFKEFDPLNSAYHNDARAYFGEVDNTTYATGVAYAGDGNYFYCAITDTDIGTVIIDRHNIYTNKITRVFTGTTTLETPMPLNYFGYSGGKLFLVYEAGEWAVDEFIVDPFTYDIKSNGYSSGLSYDDVSYATLKDAWFVNGSCWMQFYFEDDGVGYYQIFRDCSLIRMEEYGDQDQYISYDIVEYNGLPYLIRYISLETDADLKIDVLAFDTSAMDFADSIKLSSPDGFSEGYGFYRTSNCMQIGKSKFALFYIYATHDYFGVAIIDLNDNAFSTNNYNASAPFDWFATEENCFYYNGYLYKPKPNDGTWYRYNDSNLEEVTINYQTTDVRCRDALYLTNYIPINDITTTAGWYCICGDTPALPTISVDDESYCFIKIYD